MTAIPSVVVAGHICLDILPSLEHVSQERFNSLFKPGRLIEAGPAAFSTGGPVSNTGLALHRLGIPTRLVAKVGRDPFGDAVRGIVASYGAQLVEGIVSDPAVSTSYTVIISPQGADRIFLHCPGANDAFGSQDVRYDLVEAADLFHFGYPPAMRRMYQQDGRELVELLRRARETGATVSLDLSLPDPSAESGRAHWSRILPAALPYVDVFLPSVEEILFMLQRETYDTWGDRLLENVTPQLLHDLSDRLIGMGPKIVGLKLGARGFYLRTAGKERLAQSGRAHPRDLQAWANSELWAPCFKVQVAGTTGSGDATIAGFLSSLLRGLSAEEAARMAVAVGACNVEAPDALSRLQSWEDTSRRVAAGWEQLELNLDASGWAWDPHARLWKV